MQSPEAESQTSDSQSRLSRQDWPRSHGEQSGPPQSTSVSSPFLRPSSQEGSGVPSPSPSSSPGAPSLSLSPGVPSLSPLLPSPGVPSPSLIPSEISESERPLPWNPSSRLQPARSTRTTKTKEKNLHAWHEDIRAIRAIIHFSVLVVDSLSATRNGSINRG